MIKKTLIPAFIASFCFILLSCNDNSPKPIKQDTPADNTQLINRGEYLVTTMGCDDCHSPKKMGPQGPELDIALRLSGYPADRPLLPADTQVIKSGWALFNPDLTMAVGPWGATFAANLTADDTGIGKWTEAQFIKALREGKLKGLDGTRPILPPMPWQNYKKLKDDDLKAIFAYLKSTKPVKNIVPQTIPLKDIQSKKEIRKV